ncbi:Hypothetical protein Bdt_0955 [Bdellovibrio bacteriovorus str. Tiberius]|uniref:Uncharacterized protein n=1 Tax=Bdellovibrio bacteriovorus str. Tiberius TaxID=1069642 RepID=K7YVD5_BDEBC|nr:Hypothetical protein Bdt_0955 [Bdellovibrio bacteriovorus str. Tiberius]
MIASVIGSSVKMITPKYRWVMTPLFSGIIPAIQ